MKKLECLDKQWRQELKTFRYNTKFKTKEEKVFYWDSESENYDQRMFQDTRRIIAVRRVLNNHNALGKHASILEVGSGTGLYSIDLSKHCKSVTAIDLSKKMGNVLLKKAKNENITNITFRQADWTDIDLKEEGLYKAFEVSISALNPSMNSLYAIKRLCDTSKKACCIVTFAGRIKNNVHDYFSPIAKNKENDGSWTFYVQKILEELGYNPSITMTEMKWVKKHNEKDSIQRLLKEYGHMLEENIEGYVRGHIDSEGFFEEHNVTPLSIIYWEV